MTLHIVHGQGAIVKNVRKTRPLYLNLPVSILNQLEIEATVWEVNCF